MEEAMAGIAEVLVDPPRTGPAIGLGNRPALIPPVPRGFADRSVLRGSARAARNTTAEAVRALASQFPVVRRLTGDESFVACARRFVRAQARHRILAVDLGATFADFIRTLGADACYAYLADIANLEHACGRAMIAPGAASLQPDALPGGLRELATRRVVLHPSVSLTRSRFPVVSVWEAVRRGAAAPVSDCGAECALISAPRREIEVRKLPPGGFTFLTLLSQGAQIGHAAERAAVAVPGFELAAGVGLLGDGRIVVQLR